MTRYQKIEAEKKICQMYRQKIINQGFLITSLTITEWQLEQRMKQICLVLLSKECITKNLNQIIKNFWIFMNIKGDALISQTTIV